MTTVLYVEDNATLRRQWQREMTDVGLNVIQAASKDEAISVFRKKPGEISGMITDIRLIDDDENNRDGIELARELKRYDSKMPVVGYSGYTQIGVEAEFDRYFVKGGTRSGPQLVDNLSDIKATFDAYAINRFDPISNEVLQVAKKYKISRDDLASLSRGLPWSHRVFESVIALHSCTEPSSDPSEIKDISVIEKDGEHAKSFGVKEDIPILVVSHEGFTSYELLTFPMIYVYGSDNDTLVKDFLELLRMYYDSLSDDEIMVEHEIPRLFRYLEMSFGSDL